MSFQPEALKGILGFPVTPLTPAGSLDEIGFEANIQFLLKNGLDAIFICAGSGEFQSLTVEEYGKMVSLAVQIVNHRVPVYAGVGGNVTLAIELARVAEKQGTNGLLLLPPYLITPEEEGLFRYYQSVLKATSLPAILYQRDNAIFSVKLLQRLCELPQVVGFKDGYGNMELNVEMIQSMGSRLVWMNGLPFAEVTMPAYSGIGFDAYSSAMSNYLPHVSRLFFQALRTHNQSLLQEIYQICLLPINQIRKKRRGYAVSLIKAGMQIRGLPVILSVRPPLVEVEKEHYDELQQVIDHVLQRFPEAAKGS